jgi:hypothetical protein
MKRNEIVGEISLGNYRDKALKQKAQSQMGAMFARDPAEREKNLSTFNKREKGLNRLKARDEKSRKAAADKKQADDIAALPQLKAEYEDMKDKYKSLGGSNWQYADREQNLTDREREARSMEGPMNNLWRRINAAEKAQKSEEVAENAGVLKVAKDDDKQTILQNPTTGVQTQIDKTNPNAPRLSQDEQGKLKLNAPMQGGTQQQQKPNLVGKDVQVDQMPEMVDIKRLAGFK